MALKIPFDVTRQNTYYIDVRSESEFEQGHIVGAVNMPILNDQERRDVGTLYKQVSVEEAKRLGLKVASGKVIDYFDAICKVKAEKPNAVIAFYCARGGFRSRSITQLLKGIGEEVYCLDGGYKHYRHQVLAYLDSPSRFPKFIMVHGLTGVGKTKLLTGLMRKGYPVLDLEGAANHKGSHLGAIGTNEIQHMQMFENTVFHQLAASPAEYAFVESESKRIGNVYIPPKLFEAIRSGEHIMVYREMENRIKALIDEYCSADNFEALIWPAFERIKPYLSKETYGDMAEKLRTAQYEAFVEGILTKHYDPIYQKSIKNYVYDLSIHAETDEAGISALSHWYDTTHELS
ncbi:tRNA 2-selenouridine(34) synthase MnmH [Fusibacter paucivorans]|uniref:tRNA 2-selenouridine(34) synthase MnmH n=1 Tax=Fusibacter paucivorans TaxID=76009 RepID=A0ABS5PLI5_9FIRM|nr:tRNA 2-selenouridine(34) synthase MnmH [Fusibacter paucivorans]MBS7526029.1 tRNA 2-selenouridine(34) synthase MnmH [Fusibacter paucivorans]